MFALAFVAHERNLDERICAHDIGLVRMRLSCCFLKLLATDNEFRSINKIS